MVDVSKKNPTIRTAETQCIMQMNQEAYNKLKDKQLSKGDALTMAEIAGIMGAKRTQDLVSLSKENNELTAILDSLVPSNFT
ncbi:molybdenum cofactor biosynthesis protein c [Stylonychia lemnae]|uniref:Molybdenum cofactor biosynthesis protein c n=1 Tax=Stylonychia lemnae TaxID=5949 RepID=A0A078AJ52_STYLE|nr:molybdenum cofactor biosynthesis protein c [Stylonychia lemnae]|eukprot:CDW82350.1 molybdenum cofactor biosynthesis protein c [Stylonychia lemnae]